VSDTSGKISAVVGFDVDSSSSSSSSSTPAAWDGVKATAKAVTLHVVAARPVAVDRSAVDADTVRREEDVARELAKQSGKPEKVWDKMVQGRLQKFFADNCLLDQECMVPDPLDPDHPKTIRAMLDRSSKALGAKVRVSHFAVMAVGEAGAADK
jgi:elongation factor Ts